MQYKCPKCGNLIEEGTNPCPTCGQTFNWPTPVQQEVAPDNKNVKAMRKLQCEVCQSNEIVKDGDYFICQSCGCKYTDTSKILIQVDNSTEIDNLYIIARRAKENNDWEDAARTYAEILQHNPNDWEAYFYKTKCAASYTEISDIPHNTQLVINSYESTIKLILENIKDEEEQKEILRNICDDIRGLQNFYYKFLDKNGYSSSSDYKIINKLCFTLGDQILESTGFEDIANYVWNLGYNLNLVRPAVIFKTATTHDITKEDYYDRLLEHDEEFRKKVELDKQKKQLESEKKAKKEKELKHAMLKLNLIIATPVLILLLVGIILAIVNPNNAEIDSCLLVALVIAIPIVILAFFIVSIFFLDYIDTDAQEWSILIFVFVLSFILIFNICCIKGTHKVDEDSSSSSHSHSSSTYTTCNYCGGSGWYNGESCPWCGGDGRTYNNAFNDALAD